MSEQQAVTVTFRGERVRSVRDESGTYTLYRTPAGLYRVHVDQADGKAWLEPADPDHEGYTRERAYSVAPELFPENS